MRRTWMTWTARGLAIALAIFVSIFALDVFAEGYGFWESVLALLIHLVPTYLVVLALLVAWRWERVGGVLFLALAGWYLWMAGAEAYAWVLAAPALVIGALFVIVGSSGLGRRRTA